MILFLFSIGLISILGQVVILRELNVAFYGVELIFILAMGVWLLWTALGALAGRRNYSPAAHVVEWLFVCFAVLLPLDIAFIRSMRDIFGAVPGTYLPFGYQLLGVVIALFPPGILLGLLFQWAAKRYAADGGTLATAYAVESAGGLIGGLASTLLLQTGVSNFSAALVCGLAATVTVVAAPASGRSRTRIAGLIVFAALLVLVFTSRQIDHTLTRITHPSLVDSKDSPYGRISIEEHSGQYIVFENDAFSFDTEGAGSEELVHLAAIQIDSLSDVLVLGGGLDGTLRDLLKHNPRRVDFVEINRILLSAIDANLPPGLIEPMHPPSVSTTIEDPRRYVDRPGRYDLILVGMPDPASGQSNRFYTRDFFEQCAEALRPGGVLAFRLRSPENIWTPFVTYRNSSIFNALKMAFVDVVVLPASANIVIASMGPLDRDPLRLSRRLDTLNITTNLVTSQYVNYLYTNDRFTGIAERLSSTDIPANTDLRPICYRFTGMIWLSKFLPGMIHADIRGDTSASIPRRAAIILAAVLAIVFLLVKRHQGLRRVTLVAAAGFLAMVMETAFILYYQSKCGVLFQNIGILIMMFMAGLAVGAISIRFLMANKNIPRPISGPKIGISLFGGFAVVNLLFWIGLRLGLPTNLSSISFFLFGAGFLVSGVFAWMSLDGVDDQRLVVSPLYSADLLGGCVGSLAAGLFLIPFLGIELSTGTVAVLSALCLLLI